MTTTRTNIEIDDDAVKEIMLRYGLNTKREAVELALHHLVGHPMTRAEALEMHGAHAIGELPEEVMRGVPS